MSYTFRPPGDAFNNARFHGTADVLLGNGGAEPGLPISPGLSAYGRAIAAREASLRQTPESYWQRLPIFNPAAIANVTPDNPIDNTFNTWQIERSEFRAMTWPDFQQQPLKFTPLALTAATPDNPPDDPIYRKVVQRPSSTRALHAAYLQRLSPQPQPPPLDGRWPTTVSGRYVLDQLGTPWFGVIDADWAATNQLILSDQQTLVTSLAALGFKGAILQGPGILLGDNKPNDIAGNYPWTGTAFQSTLNEAYWSRVDTYIDLCRTNGITVFITPAYLGFNGASPIEGWAAEITAATNANMDSYGTALGTRYKNRPNIVWVAGGDRNPDATLLDRTDHMMAAIRAAGDTHLMTAHQNQDSTAVAIWGAYTWLDLDSNYTWNGKIAESFEGAYADTGSRPVWGIEYKYEFYDGGYTQPIGRYELWAPMLEGGFGVVMGTTPRWFEGSVNGPAGVPPTSYNTWPKSLASPLTLNAQRLANFISGYTPAQWQAMVPGVALVTTGESTLANKAAILTDTTGGNAAVYFPNSRSITVDLSLFSTHATLRLRWFDPTAATYTLIGNYSNTAGRTVTYPTSNSNSAGDDDWVLVIDAVGDSVDTSFTTNLIGRSQFPRRTHAAYFSQQHRGIEDIPDYLDTGSPASPPPAPLPTIVTRPRPTQYVAQQPRAIGDIVDYTELDDIGDQVTNARMMQRALLRTVPQQYAHQMPGSLDPAVYSTVAPPDNAPDTVFPRWYMPRQSFDHRHMAFDHQFVREGGDRPPAPLLTLTFIDDNGLRKIMRQTFPRPRDQGPWVQQPRKTLQLATPMRGGTATGTVVWRDGASAAVAQRDGATGTLVWRDNASATVTGGP